MEQTTTQMEETAKLLNRIDELTNHIQGLKLKNAFLEWRLEQRHEKTVSHYERVMPYLNDMRDRIHKIFLDLPANVGLTHKEIIEAYQQRYPAVNTKNVPRRTCELVEEDRIWRKQEPDGKARYFLKLLEGESKP